MANKLRRIFYSAANGDIIASYRHWKSNTQIPSEVAKTYSGELFSLCEAGGYHLLAVSPWRSNQCLDDGRFRIRHIRVVERSGAAYHVAMLGRSLRILWMILRSRADLAIISDRPVYWWMLAPLRLLGIRLVIAMHVRLWPPASATPKWHMRVLMALDRWFLPHAASGLLAVSQAVAADLGEIALPHEVFSPLYDLGPFARMPPARWSGDPFRLLFLGRVEENKGIFTAVDALAVAIDQVRRPIHLHVVGNGAAMPGLRERIALLDIAHHVTVHGQLERRAIFDIIGASAALIVPTRSDMGEGYNKVLAEAVLSPRPAIASDRCPAVEDMRAAAICVPADDVASYAAAIVALATDREIFEAKVAAAVATKNLYTDWRCGWTGACLRLLPRMGFGAKGRAGAAPPRAQRLATAPRRVPTDAF